MIKQVSDKQAKLNKEYKAISAKIRAEIDCCQCCNKVDNRDGSFAHEIAHIISRSNKQYFAYRENLLLLCVECHRNLDAYKAHLIHNTNKPLFDYIINWLYFTNHRTKANKLIGSLDRYNANKNGTGDPREFNEQNKPIFRRSNSNNKNYWSSVIGQYIFWHTKKYGLDAEKKDTLKNEIHANLKKNVLPMFDVTSTSHLTTEQWAEFIAECDHYFAYELFIDIHEFGIKPTL